MSQTSVNNYYTNGFPYSNDWKTSSLNKSTTVNPLTYTLKRGDGSSTAPSDNVYFNTINNSPIVNTTGINNIVTDTRKYPNFKEASTGSFKLYHKDGTTLIADFIKSGNNWNIVTRSGTGYITKLSQGLLNVVNSFIVDNLVLNTSYTISDTIVFYKIDIIIRNTTYPNSICRLYCPYSGLNGNISIVTSDSDYYFV